MADLASRVGVLEDWRKTEVDPALDDLDKRADDLESYKDSLSGSLRVIIWLNGITVGLIVLMVIALFTWGLNKLSLKVSLNPDSTGISSSQDAGGTMMPNH